MNEKKIKQLAKEALNKSLTQFFECINAQNIEITFDETLFEIRFNHYSIKDNKNINSIVEFDSSGIVNYEFIISNL